MSDSPFPALMAPPIGHEDWAALERREQNARDIAAAEQQRRDDKERAAREGEAKKQQERRAKRLELEAALDVARADLAATRNPRVFAEIDREAHKRLKLVVYRHAAQRLVDEAEAALTEHNRPGPSGIR